MSIPSLKDLLLHNVPVFEYLTLAWMPKGAGSPQIIWHSSARAANTVSMEPSLTNSPSLGGVGGVLGWAAATRYISQGLRCNRLQPKLFYRSQNLIYSIPGQQLAFCTLPGFFLFLWKSLTINQFLKLPQLKYYVFNWTLTNTSKFPINTEISINKCQVLY